MEVSASSQTLKLRDAVRSIQRDAVRSIQRDAVCSIQRDAVRSILPQLLTKNEGVSKWDTPSLVKVSSPKSQVSSLKS
jgi:hypothetical protein